MGLIIRTEIIKFHFDVEIYNFTTLNNLQNKTHLKSTIFIVVKIREMERYHVGDCGDDLDVERLGFLFRDPSPIGDPVEQFSSVGVFHHQVQATVRLNNLVQP